MCWSTAGFPPNSKFASTHLYTLVKRGTLRVKCLLQQEHNAMTLVRTRPGQVDLHSRAPCGYCTMPHGRWSCIISQMFKPSYFLYQLTWRSSDCIHWVVACQDNCCFISVYRCVRLEKENINKEYSIQNIIWWFVWLLSCLSHTVTVTVS